MRDPVQIFTRRARAPTHRDLGLAISILSPLPTYKMGTVVATTITVMAITVNINCARPKSGALCKAPHISAHLTITVKDRSSSQHHLKSIYEAPKREAATSKVTR